MSEPLDPERIEQLRTRIEAMYERVRLGSGTVGGSFGEILCSELHDGHGLHFAALAEKWAIDLPTLGDLIADHCRKLPQPQPATADSDGQAGCVVRLRPCPSHPFRPSRYSSINCDFTYESSHGCWSHCMRIQSADVHIQSEPNPVTVGAPPDSPARKAAERIRRGLGTGIRDSVLIWMLEEEVTEAYAPLEAELQRLREQLEGCQCANRMLAANVTELRQRDAEDNATQFKPKPIPMVLCCPQCTARHIDEGEFAAKLHHTHACQTCGFVWRPAVVATVGVQFLPGYKNAEPEQLANGAKDAAPRPITPEVREAVAIYLHGMLCSSLQECCVTNHSTDTRRNYETSADRIIELLNQHSR